MMGLIIGLVNGIGNTGGFAGPYIVGWLKDKYGNVDIPFHTLGVAMLVAAGLSLLLPKARRGVMTAAEEFVADTSAKSVNS
jgi:nitrate/nitrite transporter NarK